VFVVFSLATVLWAVYGYSLAFTEGSGKLASFIGGWDRLFLKGTFDAVKGEFSMAATFSKATPIYELVFVAFQATFAAITCALILGAFVERIKFSAVLIFTVIWFTFSYVPIAHMVWFWMGPDAYTSADVVDAMNAKAGYLWQLGALDFAGGTVVHINAGVAGLVGAYLVGKRLGYGKDHMAPHNLTMTMIGASLLWVGWFGFNAGSALGASGLATSAFIATHFGAAAATIGWLLAETVHSGKPSVLGGISGAVAGLVAITPASGFVTPAASLLIGFLAGLVCFLMVVILKSKLGYDDSLDAFGVHGAGGTLGAILTGVFATKEVNGALANGGGLVDGNAGQIVNQLAGTAIAWILAAAGTFVLLKITDAVTGLRVSAEEETTGLDLSMHGEEGYSLEA
jgi:Amt family ammonium transporter